MVTWSTYFNSHNCNDTIKMLSSCYIQAMKGFSYDEANNFYSQRETMFSWELVSTLLDKKQGCAAGVVADTERELPKAPVLQCACWSCAQAKGSVQHRSESHAACAAKCGTGLRLLKLTVLCLADSSMYSGLLLSITTTI